MKLPLVKYTYTQCSVKFQIPDLGENSQGQFIIRSRRAAMVYLNAHSYILDVPTE
jgi:hypothetical protein